jgi:hypothetical protein
MPWNYLDKPEEWEAAAKAARARGILGCDTETYGHNVKTSTPAYRARVDVWSLALRTDTLSPRGYHISRACVLPLAAALDGPLREVLEDPKVLKVFHNAHHDQHAFANHGVTVRGVYDTLDSVRLLWPMRDGGYSLKPLRVALLGKPVREGFKELTAPIEVSEVYYEDGLSCACGVKGCRKTERVWGAVHAKTTTSLAKTRTHKAECPIESIIPGHERWLRKLDYAGDDAADSLELHELCQLKLDYLKLPELPW